MLTLVWSSDVLLDQNLSLDRLELRTTTERHVLEGLQAELGLTLVTAVNLILTSGVPTRNSFTETVTGTISLNARIPSMTVQRLVQESFQGNALELYQFRLKISTDPALKQVQSVIIGTNVDFDSISAGTETEAEPEEEGLDTVMIAVIASVGAALVAVCCFGICILIVSRRRLAKSRDDRMVKGSYKGSVASSSKASRSRASGRSNHLMIPPVPTKSLSHEEYPPIYEDDEENQMSLISMSEMDEHSHNAPDEQSVTTSVYSYFNQDENSVVGDSSVASSIFYSTAGSTRTNDVNAKKKKGILWSVMDTMQKHFGPDSDREDDEQSHRSSMLGPSVRDEDSAHGSNNSGSLLYENNGAPTIETKASEDDDEVEDYEAEISPQAMTPVRERFERMWREDDEKEDNSVSTESESLGVTQEKDKVQSKPKGVMVFHDDNSGNNSNSVNDSCETDESPVPSVLLESTNVRSVPDGEVPVLEVTRIVNRIPDDHEEEDYDDEDNKMALPLPSQLKASDPNCDNVSQSSSLSSRSNVSGRSSGSRRNTFGAAALKAQSVRVKRDSSWSKKSTPASDTTSVNSSHSSDSAKYRSLLNQGDTNDAALFGLKNDEKNQDSGNAVSPDSALKATRLSYDQGDSAKKAEPRAQLSNLIKSFDEVWSKEESGQVPSSEQQQSQSNNVHDDSDEEDIYVEGGDDDDDGHNQSDNDSIKSGASRAVQGLSSLLMSPNKEMQDRSGANENMNNALERRLSFEIEDSSEDESDEEKKDDYTKEMDAVNMERLRRLSLAGYADTMASF